jgi:hypothetical protein
MIEGRCTLSSAEDDKEPSTRMQRQTSVASDGGGAGRLRRLGVNGGIGETRIGIVVV